MAGKQRNASARDRPWMTMDEMLAERQKAEEQLKKELGSRIDDESSHRKEFEEKYLREKAAHEHIKEVVGSQVNEALGAIARIKLDNESTRHEIDVLKGEMKAIEEKFAEEKDLFDIQSQATNLAAVDLDMKAPTGEISIVASDIPNAEVLWKDLPLAMTVAIMLHNRTLRLELKARNGYEVQCTGGLFVAAFSDPAEAVMWSLEVQLKLLNVSWPRDLLAHPLASPQLGDKGYLFRGLRVRIGIHMGTPIHTSDPISNRMIYEGPVFDLAKGICSLAKPGQILASPPIYHRGVKQSVKMYDTDAIVEQLGTFEVTNGEAIHITQILPGPLKDRLFEEICEQKEEYEQRLGELGRLICSVEVDTKRVNAVIQDFFQKLSAQSAELQTLSSQLDSEHLTQHIGSQVRGQVDSLISSLGKIRSSFFETKKNMSGLTERIEKGENELKKLNVIQAENRDLSASLSKVRADIARRDEVHDRSMRQFKKLVGKLGAARDDFNKVASELKSMQGQMI